MRTEQARHTESPPFIDLAPHYKLTFLEHPEYLHPRVEAETISRPMVREYIHRIAQKCLEVNANRLLFDRNINASLNTPDLFFAAAEFAEMMRGKCVAIVNRNREIDPEMQFLVTVARNRGGMFRLCKDIASAERCLLGKRCR